MNDDVLWDDWTADDFIFYSGGEFSQQQSPTSEGQTATATHGYDCFSPWLCPEECIPCFQLASDDAVHIDLSRVTSSLPWDTNVAGERQMGTIIKSCPQAVAMTATPEISLYTTPIFSQNRSIPNILQGTRHGVPVPLGQAASSGTSGRYQSMSPAAFGSSVPGIHQNSTSLQQGLMPILPAQVVQQKQGQGEKAVCTDNQNCRHTVHDFISGQGRGIFVDSAFALVFQMRHSSAQAQGMLDAVTEEWLHHQPRQATEPRSVPNMVSEVALGGHRRRPCRRLSMDSSRSFGEPTVPATPPTPPNACFGGRVRRTGAQLRSPAFQHACSRCRVTFEEADALRKHQRSHVPLEERRYECPAQGCTLRFHYPKDVKRHYNTAHGVVNLLACDHQGCRKMYTTSFNLNRHKNDKHSTHSALGSSMSTSQRTSFSANSDIAS